MKTRFYVTCRRPTFLLNRLLRAGVLLDKIQNFDGKLRFYTLRKDAFIAENVLLQEGIDYEKTELGVRSILRRIFARPFLLAATVFAVVGVFLFSNFVYGYSIQGNSFVNTSRVEEVLRANAVDGFVWKGALDLDGIKTQLGALDGVSFASVKVTGSRLRVEIKEELPRETPDSLLYEPVLSVCSAVVTKIVAESGTPQVKAGDCVAPGDVLVAPVYAFTEGESPAPARAEVWGVVTYEKEVLLPSVTVESVLTGEVFQCREVFWFGKQVGRKTSIPFETYDVEEGVVYSGAGVIVKQKTYRRRILQTVYHDFDAEGPRLLKESIEELLCALPFHARERGTVRAVQKKLDNLLYLVLYYSVEQRIDSPFAVRFANLEGYG